MRNMSKEIFDFVCQHVEVIRINNELWFDGKQVCDLFYDKSYESLSTLDDDVILQTNNNNNGNNSILINESGLFGLLIKIEPRVIKGDEEGYKSNKKLIDDFNRWLFDEVLPSIIGRGVYSHQVKSIPTPLNQSHEMERALSFLKCITK